MGNDTETPPPALERMNEPSSSADSPAASDGKPARNSYQYYERRSSWQGRRPSGRVSQRRSSIVPYDPSHGPRKWWRIVLREWEDGEEESWWFASTAIPLLAATIGPLANVLSIAALVTYWRMCNISGATPDDAAQCLGDTSNLVAPLAGQTYQDPHWCIALNAVSLVMVRTTSSLFRGKAQDVAGKRSLHGCFLLSIDHLPESNFHVYSTNTAASFAEHYLLSQGFVGNFFLLCNFTNRIRYIIALPVTIIMWYIATAILIALTISMELYVPPLRPQQSYTQGYVYAITAACMYMIAAMLLMVNMLGYFLGHYPQHFALTESQRTLILQTMLFFIWLAGGAAVFSKVETSYGKGVQDWSYVNSLYFCDVTILTVGFGDLYPTSDAGRGLVFPFSVGGIIMLGLMVSSIAKFAGELGSEKIIRRHVERSRTRTFGRTVTSSLELEHRQTLQDGERPIISAPFPMELQEDRQKTIKIADDPDQLKKNRRTGTGLQSLRRVMTMTSQVRIRKTKLILLREEKDHFDAMRHIQHDTTRFKHWYALLMSMIAFGVLWCAGAMVFWLCERGVQGMTYFQALYFCYVSLLTIGYGDLAPQSNAGRPFFVLWSLIAVPTMTILVSDLGETVINKFKHGTNGLADFTILPKEGVWHGVVDRIPAIATMLQWLQRKTQEHEAKKRLEEGFPAGPDPEEPAAMTLDELATDEPTRDELARRLPIAIRKTADDMKDDARKRYSYEEWVEFTRLIRFSAKKEEDKETDDDEDEGLVDWDWIGEDSPMMSKDSEAKFVLDRLCESLNRYLKQVISSNSLSQETTRKKLPADGLDDIEEALVRAPTAEDDEFMIDDVGPRNETAMARVQGLGVEYGVRI